PDIAPLFIHIHDHPASKDLIAPWALLKQVVQQGRPHYENTNSDTLALSVRLFSNTNSSAFPGFRRTAVSAALSAAAGLELVRCGSCRGDACRRGFNGPRL